MDLPLCSAHMLCLDSIWCNVQLRQEIFISFDTFFDDVILFLFRKPALNGSMKHEPGDLAGLSGDSVRRLTSELALKLFLIKLVRFTDTSTQDTNQLGIESPFFHLRSQESNAANDEIQFEKKTTHLFMCHARQMLLLGTKFQAFA